MFPIESMPEELRSQVQPEKVFTHYRVVDTEHFCICGEPGAEPCGERCYTLWSRERSCVNCISRYALKSGKPIVKLETMQNKAFYVCSLPLTQYPGYVIELAADVTCHFSDRHSGDARLVSLIGELNLNAVQDSLTGLYNDRYLYRQLQEHLDYAHQKGAPLAAAVMDVDHLSAVNDQYGSLAGDLTLQAVAAQLKTGAQTAGGWAARLSSDEFLLVIPGTGPDEAEKLCMLLSEQVAGLTVLAGENSFHVTVSFGMEVLPPQKESAESSSEAALSMDKLAGKFIKSLYRKLDKAKRIRRLEESR